MAKVIWLLVGIAFAGIAGATGREKAWQPVGGKELQALFADQDLGDGVHYAYQFHGGGRLSGMNMGKPARGNWKVLSRELCWTWSQPASEEECYEVRRHGREVRMFRDGYEAFSGTLPPLEPNTSKEVKP